MQAGTCEKEEWRPRGSRIGLDHGGGGQTRMFLVFLEMLSDGLLLAGGWMCWECQGLTHLPQLFPLPLVSQVMTSSSLS